MTANVSCPGQGTCSHYSQYSRLRTTERASTAARAPGDHLPDIGQLFVIARRIAHSLTQRERVERWGISKSLVSRVERNQKHALTVEPAGR